LYVVYQPKYTCTLLSRRCDDDFEQKTFWREFPSWIAPIRGKIHFVVPAIAVTLAFKADSNIEYFFFSWIL
jgi:hypothetical protein